jgi:hypothetical protein
MLKKPATAVGQIQRSILDGEAGRSARVHSKYVILKCDEIIVLLQTNCQWIISNYIHNFQLIFFPTCSLISYHLYHLFLPDFAYVLKGWWWFFLSGIFPPPPIWGLAPMLIHLITSANQFYLPNVIPSQIVFSESNILLELATFIIEKNCPSLIRQNRKRKWIPLISKHES